MPWENKPSMGSGYWADVPKSSQLHLLIPIALGIHRNKQKYE